jgi:hypothetical protein
LLVQVCLLWRTRCHGALLAAALMTCMLLQQLPYQPAMKPTAKTKDISILFAYALVGLLLWEHAAEKTFTTFTADAPTRAKTS